MSVQEIKSKAEFDALRASGRVLIVDFYAPWCGPCRIMAPFFEKLATENARDGVDFFKIDIDRVPEVAEEMQVQSIPSFHAIKGYERLDRVVGAHRAALENIVQTGLSWL